MEEQIKTMKLTVNINNLDYEQITNKYALQESRSTAGSRQNCDYECYDHEARNAARQETETTFWHRTRETQTIWTHEGPRGTGGNTLGIREDNQTPDMGGRASYLKQVTYFIFQNKIVNGETKHETEHKSWHKLLLKLQ